MLEIKTVMQMLPTPDPLHKIICENTFKPFLQSTTMFEYDKFCYVNNTVIRPIKME